MKKLITLALTLALAFSLTACLGSQRESTVNDIYAEKGGEITLPEGMDTSRRFNTQLEGDTMYIDFNRVMVRNTGYFSPAGDTLTLTAYATTESTGLLEFKAGLLPPFRAAARARTAITGSKTTTAIQLRPIR